MGGKGKGKRCGKEGNDRNVRISKSMTQILRHRAQDFGLAVRPDGYVRLDDVLGCKILSKFNASASDVEQITRDSDKQRFELMRDDRGVRFIRAVQGHSMKVVQDDELMRTLSADDPDLPAECVHGTYRRHMHDIVEQGLKAGGKLGQAFRNHVHFAPYGPGDGRVVSGMRNDCEVAIWLNLPEALRMGIRFFVSKNQVILTPGKDGVVPSELFVKILDISSGREFVPVGGDSAPTGGGAGSSPTRRSGGSTSQTVFELPAEWRMDGRHFGKGGNDKHGGGGPPPEHAADAGDARRLAAGESPGAATSLQRATPAAPAPTEHPAEEVLQIPSARAQLLVYKCWRVPEQFASCAVLYLHGFPDQSLNHRLECADYGKISTSVPKKLCKAVMDEIPDALFATFNFSGTPGSDKELAFADKTVSREVEDARCVIRYLREHGLPADKTVHVVGLSTGAIVSTLLRGVEDNVTITAIAGIVDVQAGLRIDFDQTQIDEFDSKGYCLKKFWLPVGSESNPPVEESPEDGMEGRDTAHKLRLNESYRKDFLSLDLLGAAESSRNPLLVIHGTDDRHVPIEHGQALFAKAAEPKEFVEIEKGNHLLTNAKQMKLAMKAIVDFIKRSQQQQLAA